jgi:hypothetical protein
MSLWIKKLEIGEMLKINTTDWDRKRPPFYIASYIGKQLARKYKCGTLDGFDGWVIKRLE